MIIGIQGRGLGKRGKSDKIHEFSQAELAQKCPQKEK